MVVRIVWKNSFKAGRKIVYRRAVASRRPMTVAVPAKAMAAVAGESGGAGPYLVAPFFEPVSGFSDESPEGSSSHWLSQAADCLAQGLRGLSDARHSAAMHFSPARQRTIVLLLAALLTPSALLAFTMAFWVIASDLRWTGEFFLTRGLFSHWEVWLASAAILLLLSRLLDRLAGAHLNFQKLSSDSFSQ